MARIQPDDGIILSVRDEGEGIQPSQLATIRAALQKDASYRAIECGGIGLGLSLSKELAAQHEGRMMIDSIRHRGTVVSMILPKERILAGMPAKRRRSL
jgi:signal transduction histidine kinase